MSNSKEEIEKSIEDLKISYEAFLKVSKPYISDNQMYGFMEDALKKEHVLSTTANKLNYHSSISQILILEDLNLEINSLKKEMITLNTNIVKQTNVSKKSSSQQKCLTWAIIFIGAVSLILTSVIQLKA